MMLMKNATTLRGIKIKVNSSLEICTAIYIAPEANDRAAILSTPQNNNSIVPTMIFTLSLYLSI